MEATILKAMVAICASMPKLDERAKCYAHLLACLHKSDNYVSLEERQTCLKAWADKIKNN